MERTSRLLLGLEALPASLLSRFGAIIGANKGFLTTNTAITRQLMRTARILEAECSQVCGEAWVRGQRKVSHVLGAFGLLENYGPFIPLIFQISFQAAVNRG